MGSRGMLHYDGKGIYSVTAFPVPPEKILNTTGAGDAVASKFLEGLIKGQDPDTILLRAAAAGAIKVQSAKVGAKEGLPTNREIDEFLSANRDQATLRSHVPKIKAGL
jgi:sugar/nucleoside kinase (ribokinase family)